MAKVILSRLAALAVILLALSAIVFALEAMIPSDPVRAMVGASATKEAVAAKRHELGFDKPLLVQYVGFLGRVATHGPLNAPWGLASGCFASCRNFHPTPSLEEATGG